MNKIWIAFLIVFCITLFGCKKEPTPGFCTIEAVIIGEGGTIDPSGVTILKFGDSKTYKVVPNDGYSPIVTVNGIIQILSSDNTFEVKADILNKKEVKVEFILKGYSFLQKDVFYFKCINIIQNGEIVDVSFNNYPDVTKSDKVIFTATQMQVTDARDGVMRPQLYFLVDPTHISIARTVYEIKILDEKNFSYLSPGFYNLKPAIYEYNFWRP